MRIFSVAVLFLVLVLAGVAFAEKPSLPDTVEGGIEGPYVANPTDEDIKKGKASFLKVAEVLQSPRCMNCHPNGDRPLQTDMSIPHAMNISRTSFDNGLTCSTCHRERNADEMGVIGGPPGAPHWQLPPKETPMIFQGRTVAELCAQLKDPKHNGGKSLAGLLHHVSHDPLVLWGWNPGGNRTLPPMSHEEFVGYFNTWVLSAGACPDPK